jgi:hypothetical protein
MTDTKDTKEADPNEGRPTTWIDVGHIAPQPEGTIEASGWKPNVGNKIYVYADTGEVVVPQPDYPVAPDVPADGVPLDPETGAPVVPEAGPVAKSSSTTSGTASKSGS